MKPFLFKPEKNSSICKLPEEWRILELFNQYTIIVTRRDKKLIQEYEQKIIKHVKDIINKKITVNDFKSVYTEIRNLFFHKESELKDTYTDSLMSAYLGPLGFNNFRILYDISDIEEVHLLGKIDYYVSDYYPYGCIKTKTAGWIGWILLYDGDKTGENWFKKERDLSKYIFLISINNFKKETALSNVTDQYNNQYKHNILSRHFKRFFINDKFWFHEDMKKLRNALTDIRLDYNESGFLGQFDIDDYYNRVLNEEHQKVFGRKK